VSGRVAVTGAGGFIGRHVTAALEARGVSVEAIRHPFARERLVQTLAGCDAVVHLAGVVSAVVERDFYRANVDATRLVAEAARDAGTRMVHVSSLAAAGPAPPSSPRSEDDAPSPVNAYGRSKLEGERAVAATGGLRWTTLRPGVVYGPGDRAMAPLFHSAKRGLLPLVGNMDAAYTFIYIDDAVRAILAALDRGIPGDTIFLGHDRPVSPRGLMDQIRIAAGARCVMLPLPRALVRLAAAAGDVYGRLTGSPATINTRRFAELYGPGFVCRVDRMRDRLGVTADTGLAAGLARASEWYLRR
jgi:nucleoside-diphosphate-sugar epimerase